MVPPVGACEGVRGRGASGVRGGAAGDRDRGHATPGPYRPRPAQPMIATGPSHAFWSTVKV